MTERKDDTTKTLLRERGFIGGMAGAEESVERDSMVYEMSVSEQMYTDDEGTKSVWVSGDITVAQVGCDGFNKYVYQRMGAHGRGVKELRSEAEACRSIADKFIRVADALDEAAKQGAAYLRGDDDGKKSNDNSDEKPF
jgi:hypothetical protein